MTEHANLSYREIAPDIAVASEEYVRLLGYPRGWTLEGRALELAEGARAWFAEFGRAWVVAQEAENTVMVVASAGPEVVAASKQLWREDKPDEAFFLHAFGAAVVERIFGGARARVREIAQARGLAVKPGYSRIPDARTLLRELSLPCPMEILDSGMLRPELSQLGALKLIPMAEGTAAPAGYAPCGTCGFTPCQFRRPETGENE
jgi:hypothetical protein